jgi:hypothetical protein
MGKTQFGMAVAAAGFALSLSLSAANAVPIILEFNFVPNGTLTANTGDVTTATSITTGAPLTVTSIVANNTGLVSGQSITMTSPTPVTLGSTFTKSFTTPLGSFLENLTVSLVTPGPSSLGVTATGTITQTAGTGFDPTPVFYSAAYTQNGGPGNQINASFNDSTTAVPGPIAGAGLPGLILAAGGLLALARRRRQLVA